MDPLHDFVKVNNIVIMPTNLAMSIYEASKRPLRSEWHFFSSKGNHEEIPEEKTKGGEEMIGLQLANLEGSLNSQATTTSWENRNKKGLVRCDMILIQTLWNKASQD